MIVKEIIPDLNKIFTTTIGVTAGIITIIGAISWAFPSITPFLNKLSAKIKAAIVIIALCICIYIALSPSSNNTNNLITNTSPSGDSAKPIKDTIKSEFDMSHAVFKGPVQQGNGNTQNNTLTSPK